MWNKQTYHKLSYSLNEENAVLFCLNIRRNVSLRLIPAERSMQQFWNKYAGLRKLSFMRQNQKEKRQHTYETENNSLAPTTDTGSKPWNALRDLCTNCKSYESRDASPAGIITLGSRTHLFTQGFAKEQNLADLIKSVKYLDSAITYYLNHKLLL